MRLFVALDIDPDIREKMARFVEGVRELAPDVRWVGPQSFHVTLKFIAKDLTWKKSGGRYRGFKLRRSIRPFAATVSSRFRNPRACSGLALSRALPFLLLRLP